MSSPPPHPPWHFRSFLWRLSSSAQRHGCSFWPPASSWLSLSKGAFLEDIPFVQLITAPSPPEMTSRLAERLWPEYLAPLPFKVQVGVLADLLAADTSDSLCLLVLPHLVPIRDEFAGGPAKRYDRFVWDLCVMTRNQLRTARTFCFEPGSHLLGFNSSSSPVGLLLLYLQLLHDLFVRGGEKKTLFLGDRVLRDLAFLPQASDLLHSLNQCVERANDGTQATASALCNRLDQLSAAIGQWQTVHCKEYGDVVTPPGKKQILQHIQSLLGLREPSPLEHEREDEKLAVQCLRATDGLEQLLHRAETGSMAALRLLVDCETANSVGLERWLEGLSKALWFVPLIQISELVYTFLTALIRIYVTRVSFPPTDVQGDASRDGLKRQISKLYLECFKELPQTQQATTRAFCYLSSVKSSQQDVKSLNNEDDEKSLLDGRSGGSEGQYLFQGSALAIEAEDQLTVQLNRLVPECLEDKNYLSSLYEISLVIPFRLVERIVLEGIANPKQSSVLCLLLNSLGVLSRYPLHGSEDGMTLLGTVLESSIGDLNWIINSTQDYKNNCIAMLVLLLKPRPPAGNRRPTITKGTQKNQFDERVLESLREMQTAICDGIELMAFVVVPQFQQLASDIVADSEIQEHITFLLDLLLICVFRGTSEYNPEQNYYARLPSDALTPDEKHYLIHHAWTLEAYPWELLLALCRLLDRRWRLQSVTVARLIRMMERISAFLALSIIAQIRHPNLPDQSHFGISPMVDFQSEVKSMGPDVRLRLQPLFSVAVSDQNGLSQPHFRFNCEVPTWPRANNSAPQEQLVAIYARCLFYCRTSDYHCEAFLERISTGDAAALPLAESALPYQLVAFAVVLSYSTADEFSRLINMLFTRMLAMGYLAPRLPSSLPMCPSVIMALIPQPALAATSIKLLCGQVSALHLILRIIISLILPRVAPPADRLGDLATLYWAVCSPTAASLEQQSVTAPNANRDDLLWTVNYVRVVHDMVKLWDENVKRDERERSAVANLIILSHALVISVKLLCVLQAASSDHQQQVGILALDIAHRLQSWIAQPTTQPPVVGTGTLELVKMSREILAGSGPNPENQSLAIQLERLTKEE